ncbi:helix-turn-helix transcriptional regulator [Streptomyces sp. NPDC001276]|uniref:helix-turn-helix transcriptional regulator n=1 Tax=Streptomyces sp. NPDC001276 TaxID=3364555 RepID=UPI0036953945
MSRTPTPMEVLSHRVKELRELHGWTATRLGAELQKAGLTWDRFTVASLESGKRQNVTLVEWLALARALSVPPLLLFIPLGHEDRVEITPGVQVHPDLALKWVVGEEQPMTSDRRVTGDAGFWLTAQIPLSLYRRFNAAQAAMGEAEQALFRAEYTGDAARIQDAKAAGMAGLERLAAVLDDMADGEVRPPALPGRWLGPIRELGLSKRPADLPAEFEASQDEGGSGGESR